MSSRFAGWVAGCGVGLLVLGTHCVAEACALASGQRVALASNELDPDVFVWDSKQRMSDYAAGSWGNVKEVFTHTLLSKPGTVAVILTCETGTIHSRLSNGIQDAVAVKILSGPNRGRQGWVASEDVRLPRPR